MGRTPTPAATMLPHPGLRLRRLRRLRGIKQSAMAEMAGVTQATVSRWEKGALRPDPHVVETVLRHLARSRPGSGDAALRRLVESSRAPVHLVTDVDHRLLAASPARVREWNRDCAGLLGTSLWRFATPGIQQAEQGLAQCGWWEEECADPVEVRTGPGTAGLTIRAGLMVWERIYLADGTPARLCTTVAFS